MKRNAIAVEKWVISPAIVQGRLLMIIKSHVVKVVEVETGEDGKRKTKPDLNKMWDHRTMCMVR
jgi:hypothetical protein